MAGQKIFISCLVTLILFNILFFVTGLNSELFTYDKVLATFVTLGIIAVVISALPIIDSESTMRWFVSIVIICSIMYSITFNVLGYNITIGVGLASNLTNMFVANINNISFLPWLFFTSISLLGIISGIMAMSGGD